MVRVTFKEAFCFETTLRKEKAVKNKENKRGKSVVKISDS